jgi:hypothetical protein
VKELGVRNLSLIKIKTKKKGGENNVNNLLWMVIMFSPLWPLKKIES